MKLENLRKNHEKLISFMEDEGKHKTYIRLYKKVLDVLLANPTEQEWQDYESFYSCFISTRPASMEKQYKTVIAAIRAFDLFNHFPNGENRTLSTAKPTLCEGFNGLLEHYISCETAKGRIGTVTIERNVNSAKTFLKTLEAAGVTSLDGITEEAVLSLFTKDDGKLTKGTTYFYAVKCMFSVCAEKFGTGTIAAMIPTVRKRRKNAQYLTSEESAKIRNALMNPRSPLNYRDRAIGTIAYYTGLRRSDIARLQLDSFDLVNEKIYIHQQKTRNPLELPLRAIVGNAVYDYVTLERPQSHESALFLNRYRRQIKPQNLWGVSNKVMKAAGIRQEPTPQRKGFHIFRHHLASKLLESEIPQPVISSALGHADPASVEAYLSTDFLHLKDCSLSVDRFPVAEGVFR